MSAATQDPEVNPYDLLGLGIECTKQEIQTAYRQTSRKVHPDRNRNDPDAAQKFHALTQASELLLDPLRRLALDAKLRLKAARDARYKNFDAKRKTMVSDLEERERAFKKAKMDQETDEAGRRAETEKIQEAGRKMREERERQAHERQAEAQRAAEDEDLPPTMHPLDTAVRLKFKSAAHPALTTPTSLAELLRQFGETDADGIVLSTTGSKKNKSGTDKPDKPSKYTTAAVLFKQIGDAFAAVGASGRAERGLDGIDVVWAGGKEPDIIRWLKRTGKLSARPLPSEKTETRQGDSSSGTGQLPQTSPAASDSYSTFPTSFVSPPDAAKSNAPVPSLGLDYEAVTLMRMRQAERERLEREILAQEAED
ncbi:unnamed protein product [Mycena citricolor]|uniref:J domain-containing protein n=1 Tax=Mycena citricolor TaxID=2018698 RepID=A0AAD2JU50_9AGAR|nr:unnamed protein product [Mycena citricolor]